MGETNREEFPITVGLVALTDGQIRHNALEAARIIANAHLTKKGESKGFRLRINLKPHHIMRENKMMAFAGADRLQAGMRASFGKPSGTAARVQHDQVIMLIHCDPAMLDRSRRALYLAHMKIPIRTKNVILHAPEEIMRKFR